MRLRPKDKKKLCFRFIKFYLGMVCQKIFVFCQKVLHWDDRETKLQYFEIL